MTEVTQEEDDAWKVLEHKLGRGGVQSAAAKLNIELELYRNEIIDEVATAIEKFDIPFGRDTVSSFAAYVRGLKHDY